MDESFDSSGHESIATMPSFNMAHHLAFQDEDGVQDNHDCGGGVALISPRQVAAGCGANAMGQLEDGEEAEEDDEEARHPGGEDDDFDHTEHEEGDYQGGDAGPHQHEQHQYYQQHLHQYQQQQLQQLQQQYQPQRHQDDEEMAASEGHAGAAAPVSGLVSSHSGGAAGGEGQGQGQGVETDGAPRQSASYAMPPGYACAPFIFNGMLCNYWPASWGPMPLQLHPTFKDRIVKPKTKRRQWKKTEKELILKVLESNGGDVKGTVAALKKEYGETFGSLQTRSVAAWAAQKKEDGRLKDNMRGKRLRAEFETAVHSLLAFSVCAQAGITATTEELDAEKHAMPIDKVRAKVFLALATTTHGIPYTTIKQKCEEVQKTTQFANDAGVQRLTFSGAYISNMIKRLVASTEDFLDAKKPVKKTRKQKDAEEQEGLAEEMQEDCHLNPEQGQGPVQQLGIPPAVAHVGVPDKRPSAFSSFSARTPAAVQMGMSPAQSNDAPPHCGSVVRSAGSTFEAAPGAVSGDAGGDLQGRVPSPASPLAPPPSDDTAKVAECAHVEPAKAFPGDVIVPGFAFMIPPADGPREVARSSFTPPPRAGCKTGLVQGQSLPFAAGSETSPKNGQHQVHAQHEQQEARPGLNEESIEDDYGGNSNFPDGAMLETHTGTHHEVSSVPGEESSTSCACAGVQDAPDAQSSGAGNTPALAGDSSSTAANDAGQPQMGAAGPESSQRGQSSMTAFIPEELSKQLKMVMPKPRARKTWTIEEKTNVLDALAIHNGNIKRTIKALKMSFGGDYMRLHPRCVSRWLKDYTAEGQMVQRTRGRIVNHEFESEVLQEILSIQKDSIAKQGGRMTKTSVTDHVWLASLTHCPPHVVQRAAETVKEREKWQDDTRVQGLLLSSCWATGMLKRHIPVTKKRKRGMGTKKKTGKVMSAVVDIPEGMSGQQQEFGPGPEDYGYDVGEEGEDDDEYDENEGEVEEGEEGEEEEEEEEEEMLEHVHQQTNVLYMANGGGRHVEGQPVVEGQAYGDMAVHGAGPVHGAAGFYEGSGVARGMIVPPATPGQQNFDRSLGGAVYGRWPML
jgi:hypothetical protein